MVNEQGQGLDFQSEEFQQQPIIKRKYLKKTRTKWAIIIAAIICFVSISYRALQFLALNYFFDVKETPRAKLQQPRLKQSQMTLWTIHHPQERLTHQKTSCTFINAGNIVTTNTINTITRLMQQQQFGFVFVMVDLHDVNSRILLRRSLPTYQISATDVQFDIDFAFLDSIKSKCSKLVYMFGNFKINRQMSTNITAEAKSLPPLSLYYTSIYLKGESVMKSNDLQTSDLSQLDPNQFYLHLYIFDTDILNIFAPFNFVYYSKYTIEEIVLIPALVYYQSAQKMHTTNKIMHSLSVSFVQFKQFSLESLPKEEKSLCFISYVADLYNINEKNAIQYIQSVQNQSLQEMKATVIIYLPYRFNQTQNISKVTLKLVDLANKKTFVRARIRIISDKISPAHAVYESVYSHCPNRGMIISSRHNVKFHKNMAQEVLNWASARYHYYYFNFEDQNGQKHDLDTSIDYDYEFLKRKGKIFEQKLRHVQVFKSDLMKMVPFWILKSAQVDFYETEAPFVFNMIQTIRIIKIKIIQEPLAVVKNRTMSSTQLAQIRNIKLYSVYSPLLFNVLLPYPFNSLQNPVYRRNAPFKIPPNLHQIWLSNSEISDLRMALHKTMVGTNPNFKMHLWKKQNVTKENLPLTYNLISIILEKNKQSSRSLIVMAVDLMRYQVILQNGGIYVDFKWQGNRPLDNFLKYESFFIDFDNSYIRFGRPKAVGNGFMGATTNNYHLRAVLTQLLNEHTLTFGKIIPYITGGWIVRNTLTDQEIFTQIGLGYHLFVPTAYEDAADFCGGTKQEHYDSDQKVYAINYKGQEMRLVIPCKLYPESYGVLYHPLAGTWKIKNTDIS